MQSGPGNYTPSRVQHFYNPQYPIGAIYNSVKGFQQSPQSIVIQHG